MNFGLDLLSRPPQGGLLSTVASSARAPTAQLFQDIKEQKTNRRATEAGLFEALIKAQADERSNKETGIKIGYEDRVITAANNLIKANEKAAKGLITPAQLNSEIIRTKNIASTYLPNFQVGMTENEKIEAAKKIKTALEASDSRYTDPRYAEILISQINARVTQLEIDLINSMLTGEIKKALQLPEEEKEKIKKAEGGRIGYQNAGPVMPSAQQGIMAQAPMTMDQEPTESGISYDELRARLPSEITDDIVRLISESPQALEDFATIQTQQDVNNFNTKYGVNLTLPPEA
jgi:hypothetical protein